MKNKFLIIAIFVSIKALIAQNSYINKADKYFENGNYYSASYLYKIALNNAYNKDLEYKYAEACRLNYDYGNAEIHYKNLIYINNFNNPMLYFNLATVQKSLGKYQLAQRNFTKFLNKYQTNDFYRKKAEHEYHSCEDALNMSFQKNNSLNIEHCDTPINTIYGELQIAKFGNDKYFTALRPVLSDTINNTLIANLFFADSSKIEKINFQSNDSANISNFCFNTNQNRIYFTKCKNINNIFRCNIFSGDFSENTVSNTKKLSASVNFPGYNSTQPYITNYKGKELMFFSSDRNDGFGKYDIWVSEIYEDGSNGSAQNLGKVINSIDNEITPYFDSKKEILYFSSEWYSNFGGFDIFKSSGNLEYWNEPINMGLGLNSNYNDIYYNQNINNTKAFFSSNREQSLTDKIGNCCNDFYHLNIHNEEVVQLVNVQKTKKEMKELIPITLYFHNDEPNPKTTDTTTQISYNETYFAYTKMIETYENEFSKGLANNKKIEAVEAIGSFFSEKVDKEYAKLTNFSILLKELLIKGEEIKIVIKGFASPLNSTEYNVNLSKRRIESLVNYFRTFDDGFFVKYIDGNPQVKGKITFERIAFGEDSADLNISDNLLDLKNSVYSPQAANERKIKVIAVSFGENK